MDEKIIVALVASFTAIVVALWSVATSGRARSMALRAEERAKRGELVRVKALEAMDTVLDAIWDLIQMIRYFRGAIKYEGGVNWEDPEVIENMEILTTRHTTLGRLRLRMAPYLTPEIDAELSKVLELVRIESQESHLDEVEKKLEDIARSISDLCRKEYLI